MRLISLRLNNFRQFYSLSPKITFSHGEKNITIVHGSNGSGKTSLLNAFTWTLFDSLTPGFQLPEQIVNKRAIREAEEGKIIEAWVEIEFEHVERIFRVKRIAKVERTSKGEGYIWLGAEKPIIQWCGPDGRWDFEDEFVYEAIWRILPQDLHTYFFFDGERIERLVQQSKKEKKEIGEATKKLLGLEIFSRAERHLNAVRRELEKELRQVGDAETSKLIEIKQRKEHELEQIESRQDEIVRNVDAHELRKKEIETLLRKHVEVEAIQKRRDQLNIDKEARVISYNTSSQNLASTISSSGYMFFLQEPIDQFLNLIDSLRKKGELPAGIKQQFVNDLLKQEKCICKRDLKPQTAPRSAVEDWMARAGLADVEEKAIRMGGEISKITQLLPKTTERIEQIQHRRESDRKALIKIDDELEEINEKLIKSPKEEISALQGQLNEIGETIKNLSHEHGDGAGRIRNLHSEIKELTQNISKHQSKEDKQRLAQRRVQAAVDSARVFCEMRELMEKEFRKGLQRKITELFNTISPTPYVPELGEDYSLHLLESAGGAVLPVAASQGESQILSLSFIGSIMQYAREYYAKQKDLPAPDTSTYPVVMDSPFGSLDPIYRHQIAEHLPVLADQIVVLLTKTQWRGEVEQSMQNRIGRSYVLTYYSPKNNILGDSIEIKGMKFDLINKSPNEFEYTEIIEVPHD